MSTKTDKEATKKEEAAEQEYLAKQAAKPRKKAEPEEAEVEVQKAPGKPPPPFKPGVDPVPVPNTVVQHPLYSDPGAAKPI